MLSLSKHDLSRLVLQRQPESPPLSCSQHGRLAQADFGLHCLQGDLPKSKWFLYWQVPVRRAECLRLVKV